MKIQSHARKEGFVSVLTRKAVGFLSTKTWLLLLFLFAGMLGMFFGGFYLRDKISDRQKEKAGEFMGILLDRPTDVVKNYWRGLWAEAPQLRLDIKHTYLQRLIYDNWNALKNGGRLVTTNADSTYVPIHVSYEGKTIKAKARIKGNWKDARDMDKLSLRIKVKGENSVMGMKKFSLHHPKVKSHIAEWIFHKLLEQEDFVAMRYDFVEVIINGKSRGIHAIEEHFDKRLIEHNRNREGVIIRIDEYQDFYRHLYNNEQQNDSAKPWLSEVYSASPIDAYGWSKIKADPKLMDQFIRGRDLLEAFRKGDLKTSDVFDVPSLAKLFALSDLLGTHHNLEIRNIKFYYNPVTSKLQPIGYDQHHEVKLLPQMIGEYVDLSENPDKQSWQPQFFKDPIFFNAYIEAVETVSSKQYRDRFWKNIQSEYDSKMELLQADEPLYFDHSRATMEANSEFIHRVLHPLKAVEAYKNSTIENGLVLNMANIHSLPVEVTSLSYYGKKIATPKGGVILPAKLKLKPLEPRLVTFDVIKSIDPDTLNLEFMKIHSHIVGLPTAKIDEPVHDWQWYDQSNLEGDLMLREANHEEFEFCLTNDETKTIHLVPGEWVIDRPLLFPTGYKVISEGGFTLDMVKGGFILSRSTMLLEGSEEHPLLFYSSDSTGMGLTVLQAAEPSKLTHVYFKHLNCPKSNGWSLSGAVNYYESEIALKNVWFERNFDGDDYLNIIRSTFTMDQCNFYQTTADAFDGDFCEGKITNTQFVDCGNDAIDVSGSHIEMDEIYLAQIGDKALSAGEGSSMVGNNIKIKFAEIAVTSKDLSEVDIEHLEIDSCRVGYTAFQKKPEFGAAAIRVSQAIQSKIERPFLIESGSTMEFMGEIIPPSQSDVKAILYGNEYGKKSG